MMMWGAFPRARMVWKGGESDANHSSGCCSSTIKVVGREKMRILFSTNGCESHDTPKSGVKQKSNRIGPVPG